MKNSTFSCRIGLMWAIICFTTFTIQAQSRLKLTTFASGFSKPLDITHCGDSRLFVVEQNGKIWILDSLGTKQSTPFLDIDPRVNSNGNEQGLLGLAFHPNFAQNGWFFVNYTIANGDTRISRFSLLAGSTTTADPASEKILLTIDQPYSNHNGGCLKFGPDGHLYCSLGDGGSGGDPQNNSQKRTTLLGKMLRLDVNVTDAPFYSVPTDNPFVGQSDYLPEIWSLGLRNVWRFSFDRLTGDMWMADVGQNNIEEIDFEPANIGGLNYGWRCYEGTATYNTANCLPASNYKAPVFEYNQSAANGCSVTGGFVYRGTQFPGLVGKYIFADYCSGRFWCTERTPAGGFSTQVAANLSAYQYSSFGEDNKGELYVATLGSGRIERLVDACATFTAQPTIVQPSCTDGSLGSITLAPAGGVSPYTYSWTGAGMTASLTGLKSATYTVQVRDNNLCTFRDTFLLAATGTFVTPAITANKTWLCPEDTTNLILNANPPAGSNATYQWYVDNSAITGATNAILQIPPSQGDYYVRWSFANGCPSVDAQPISINIGVLAINPDLSISNGYLFVSDSALGGINYQWYFNGQLISGATYASFKVTMTGDYTMQRTSILTGCTDFFTVNVVVSNYEALSLLRFGIHPNPTKGVVQLDALLGHDQAGRLTINNATGQLMHQAVLQGSAWQHGWDMSAWPSGVYFVSLQMEGGMVVKRLVKE